MNKKVMSISLIILLIIGGSIFGIYKNEQKKSTPDNKYITVKFRDASLGSILGVDLTEEGKKKYSIADSYRVFREDNQEMSVDPRKIGEETIVIPKTKPGKTVVVYLYDKDEKLIDKLSSKVIK